LVWGAGCPVVGVEGTIKPGATTSLHPGLGLLLWDLPHSEGPQSREQ
jgi:hypothetical protein